jgi:uncharacterized membrane protein
MPSLGSPSGGNGTATRRAMMRFCRFTVLGSYFSLLSLLTLGTVWLAPNPHFPISLSLLVLVGPLLLPLRGLLHGHPDTPLLTSFLALYYFVLGVDDLAGGMAVRALAWLELILSLTLFAGCLAYTRLRDQPQQTVLRRSRY